MTHSITTTVLPDGLELAYRRWGAGQAAGRALLIHPLALDGSLWAPVAARLAEAGLDVVAPDCRGHGQSGKAPGPYSVQQFGSDMEALLEHLGWENAIVAGCSMGGCVAQAFALAAPRRLAGLVLVDTTAWYGPEAPRNWGERAEKARTGGLAAMSGFQATRWFSDAWRGANPGVVANVAGIFVANDLACYAASCDMLGKADLREGLEHIAVPTTVIVGEEDYATPVSASEDLVRRIPGATLSILPGARHLTLVECPDAVATALLETASLAPARA